MSISKLQAQVLFIAQCHDGHVRFDHNVAPHGVFRALCMRGFLRPNGAGYQVTPEGELKLEEFINAHAA